MKQLKWGQTPFDTLSREELLFVVKKFFSAIISAESTLETIKYGDKNSPFWTKGTGFSTLEKLTQCTENIINEYDSENIYRLFYRYADDLLFENVGFNWMVCDKCERMFGSDYSSNKPTCILCGNQLRPIEWKDLETNEKL